jgi:hypothetical protein
MVGISPVIFTGTVVGVRYATPRGSQYPFTYVRFGGVTFIRRDAPVTTTQASIEIAHAGGVRPDMRAVEVSSQPKFVPGARYLVFIRGGEWRLSPIPGGNMGYFLLRGRAREDPVVADPNSGAPLSGFENGRPTVAPDRLRDTVQNPDTNAVRRTELTVEEARQLGLIAGERRSAAQIAATDSAMRVAAARLDTAAVSRDADEPRELQRRFAEPLRLSVLRRQILQLREATRGRYPGFERVTLVPRPVAEFRARTPRDSS